MIKVDEPNITDLEISHVVSALDDNQISTNSYMVNNFETETAKLLGVHDAVATNSGTSALHLALIDAGVKPGDKVALPVLSFIATANVIKYMGAEPLFIDVDPDSWCIQLGCIGNSSAKCVIGVNLYGMECDWDKLYYDFVKIEDAAQSFGINNTEVDYKCYSFNGNKIITTGGGGLVIGGNTEAMRRHSNQAKIGDFHINVGLNCRMTGLSAALGLGQLKRLPEFLKTKKRINELYRQELPMLQFQKGREATWWYTAALFPKGTNIESMRQKLIKAGIQSRRVFRPITHYPPYSSNEKFPVAQDIYERGLCLPSHTNLTEGDINIVCKTIKNSM